MMSNTQRVLVTGGCGFIGSHLVKKLIDLGRYDVDVVDNLDAGSLERLSDVDYRCVASGLLPVYEKSEEKGDPNAVLVIAGDFVDPNVLDRVMRREYDIVFHLAANPRVSYSVEHPTITTEENVYKTVALFEACQKSGVRRIVFSSSCAVYGDIYELPTHELDISEANIQSPYGLQKKVCEDFAQLFHKLYNMDIVSLRYFNVYGPGQMGTGAYSTAVSAWCNAAYSGSPLRSDGDGLQTRDMIYVEDVVLANVLAAEAPPAVAGKCFNIATGKAISNNDILEMFRERFGDRITVVTAPERSGDVKHTLAYIKNAESELGFRAQTSFFEGLQKTWNWWDNLDLERPYD